MTSNVFFDMLKAGDDGFFPVMSPVFNERSILLPDDLFDSIPAPGCYLILITGGNTLTMIDAVRGITNIFQGKTAADMAKYLAEQGNNVVLVTSQKDSPEETDRLKVLKYVTYDELYALMWWHLTRGGYEIVIHSAAVSDYYVDATMSVIAHETKNWHINHPEEWYRFEELDSTKKVSSDHSELYLRMKPTRKIIGRIRDAWGFHGILVQFKLQVGITKTELLKIMGESVVRNDADYIVGNCLEWAKERAIILPQWSQEDIEIDRKDLPEILWEMIG